VQWLLKCPSLLLDYSSRLLQTSHVHKVCFRTRACVVCPAARSLLVLVAGGIGYHSYGSIVELAAAAAHAVDTGAVDTGSGSGPADHATKAALAVAAASILVKEALFHWTHAVGVRTASSVSAAHGLSFASCMCCSRAALLTRCVPCRRLS
jgi:divalent metal cation (Fe/Co/Zn/Cd) transporter